MSKFVPNDRQITLAEAEKLIQDRNTAVAVRAICFSKASIEQVLAQKGCTGIRVFFGQSGQGAPRLVLCGVDDAGNDMKQGVLIDDGVECPPFCGQSSLGA